jgi:hypothetical protein
MRAFFLALLLANLFFFAWASYLSPGTAGSDPAPLARQTEPEKLKVVRPDSSPAASAAEAPAAPPAAPAAPQPAALACLEWGSFTPAEAARAEKALEALAPGAQLAQRRTQDGAGWWVYIGSLGDRASAVRRAAELKSLGIDDYFIVQEEGRFRWALSLGVFRSEEAAKARVAALERRGVRGVELAAREGLLPRVWLQVKGVDAPLQARLAEIAGSVEGSALRACAAG